MFARQQSTIKTVIVRSPDVLPNEFDTINLDIQSREESEISFSKSFNDRAPTELTNIVEQSIETSIISGEKATPNVILQQLQNLDDPQNNEVEVAPLKAMYHQYEERTDMISSNYDDLQINEVQEIKPIGELNMKRQVNSYHPNAVLPLVVQAKNVEAEQEQLEIYGTEKTKKAVRFSPQIDIVVEHNAYIVQKG